MPERKLTDEVIEQQYQKYSPAIGYGRGIFLRLKDLTFLNTSLRAARVRFSCLYLNVCHAEQ